MRLYGQPNICNSCLQLHSFLCPHFPTLARILPLLTFSLYPLPQTHLFPSALSFLLCSPSLLSRYSSVPFVVIYLLVPEFYDTISCSMRSIGTYLVCITICQTSIEYSQYGQWVEGCLSTMTESKWTMTRPYGR